VQEELARDARQRRDAHENDERVDRRRQARPVHTLAVAALVTGHDGERACAVVELMAAARVA